ncbi:unnamed protein product [Caenorhabditis auriculariae]|uniref:Uncharacterized protein n=1 Tax=Caenorhabditis auriculariae TaxID=2777116 RepID=A0A8S1HXC0_9PELO|nr:unnamed protein product [Caenorhabditis auriculariae]
MELNLLYSLRRTAYENNAAIGLHKYVVRDLTIIELKNPKPFQGHPKQTQTPMTSPLAKRPRHTNINISPAPTHMQIDSNISADTLHSNVSAPAAPRGRVRGRGRGRGRGRPRGPRLFSSVLRPNRIGQQPNIQSVPQPSNTSRPRRTTQSGQQPAAVQSGRQPARAPSGQQPASVQSGRQPATAQSGQQPVSAAGQQPNGIRGQQPSQAGQQPAAGQQPVPVLPAVAVVVDNSVSA